MLINQNPDLPLVDDLDQSLILLPLRQPHALIMSPAPEPELYSSDDEIQLVSINTFHSCIELTPAFINSAQERGILEKSAVSGSLFPPHFHLYV